jgi:hypothetical protein
VLPLMVIPPQMGLFVDIIFSNPRSKHAIGDSA